MKWASTRSQHFSPLLFVIADDLVLCDPDREMMKLRLERWTECMEKNGLKVSRARTEHIQTTQDTYPVRMKIYMETEMANLSTAQSNDRQKRRSQQIHGEQGSKGPSHGRNGEN